MKKIRAGWLWAVLGVGMIGAVAFVSLDSSRDQRKAPPMTRLAQTPLPAPAETPAARPPELTSLQQQVYAALDPASKEAVNVFFANTAGPLDNYLLRLEGITNVGNARYGQPDREGWQQALPVAKILEQGMCDCEQRNWLNQFIATGEAGLGGDLVTYHQQGATMAGIARYVGDPVGQR